MDSPATNLSVLLKGVADITIVDQHVSAPGRGEVMIKMHSVGICGSDVHYYSHGRIGNFVVKEPMILGHESSGTVVKVGPGVTSLNVGDRVAIEPGVPCRHCEYCLAGRYNLCAEVQFLATPPVHGSLRQFHVHAADFCYKLPDHVSLEEGALLEPLSVGVHACRRGGVGLGKSVLVFGAGPIGLVCLMVARAMAADRVVVVDISEHRVATAKSMGAHAALVLDKAYKPGPDLVNKLHELLDGAPHVTIECTGAEAATDLALQTTRSGGCVVLVGLGPSPQLTVSLVTNVAVREVDVRGVFRYANCYPSALSLVASGRVNLKALVTHRFPMSESASVFNQISTGGLPEAIKIVLQCV